MKKFKADIILIIGIVIVAFVLLGVMSILKKDGRRVVISVDGKIYENASLEDDKIIEISAEAGYNKVIIKNNKVHMESADCPDKICVKTAAISKEGETIVCLPHKVIVKITGDEDLVDGEVR